MGDLIDRQAAIDAFEKKCTLNCTDRNGIYTGKIRTAIMYEGVMEILNNIPSAESERKKGEWIKEDLSGYLTPGGNSIYHCSECGHTEGPYPYPRLTNFCPSCGADMRGER